MLRGWPAALVAATGSSALVGFGAVQSVFTAPAQGLFIAFAATLLLVVVLRTLFGKRPHASRKHHGEGGVVFAGRAVGAIMMLAAVMAVVVFWTDNNLSGEKIGRFIDRGAVSMGRQAQATFERASTQRDRTPDEAAPTES